MRIDGATNSTDRTDRTDRTDGTDAPVVLLVHGFGSSLHSFDRMTQTLSLSCRVLRMDLLGHGSAATAPGPYDAESQATAVEVELDRLGVEVEAVVGHSFGADVAIALAERRPGMGRVVVIGQAPDYDGARIPRGSRLLTRPRLGPILHRRAPARVVMRAARFAFAPGVRPGPLYDRPDRLVTDQRAMTPAAYRTVLVDRPRQLAANPLDRRLAGLGRPALVILGARDQLYPVSRTQARYAAVPGVRVEVLAGSGHSPPLEQPRECATLIAEFVLAGRPHPDGAISD